MKPPSAESFLNSLSIDGNGNLMFEERRMETSHSLRLSNTHHRRRGQSEEERLEKIKDSLKQIQEEILCNIHDNLQDKIGEETFSYAWSALDLTDKSCNLDQRLTKLELLLQLLTDDRIHEVQKYRTTKEDDDTVPFVWEGRNIYLHYKAAIPCSYNVLLSEIKAA